MLSFRRIVAAVLVIGVAGCSSAATGTPLDTASITIALDAEPTQVCLGKSTGVTAVVDDDSTGNAAVGLPIAWADAVKGDSIIPSGAVTGDALHLSSARVTIGRVGPHAITVNVPGSRRPATVTVTGVSPCPRHVLFPQPGHGPVSPGTVLLLSAEVGSDSGYMVPDATGTWTILNGGGSLAMAQVAGQIAVNFIAGPTPGPQRLEFSSPGFPPDTVTITVVGPAGMQAPKGGRRATM
jgi:hypothetical protein